MQGPTFHHVNKHRDSLHTCSAQRHLSNTNGYLPSIKACEIVRMLGARVPRYRAPSSHCLVRGKQLLGFEAKYVKIGIKLDRKLGLL